MHKMFLVIFHRDDRPHRYNSLRASNCRIARQIVYDNVIAGIHLGFTCQKQPLRSAQARFIALFPIPDFRIQGDPEVCQLYPLLLFHLIIK